MRPLWSRYLPAPLRGKIEHRPDLLKIVGNVAWLFSDKIFRMGMGLLIGVWIARYLGPQQFGLLSFAMAFVSLFGAIATLGLQGIVVRDIVRSPETSADTLGTSFALQLVGGVAAFLLLVAVINFLRENDQFAITVITILGLTLIFKASESAKYWFESRVQSKYTVWTENTVFLSIVLIKVWLILHHAPLIAFVWVVFAEAVLLAIALLIISEWRGGGFRRWRIDLNRAKMLLKDSWPLILSGLAVMIYMRVDQIMLGQMIDDNAVGIYTAAVRLSEMWFFIPVVIAGSVFPSLIEAKETNEALYLQRFQKLYDILTALALAVAIPVTLFADQVILNVFGQRYAEAGQILSIHIWTAVFVFLGVASGKWFIAENRQVLAFQRVACGMVINIVLNIVWIPEYGASGAAFATLVSQAVSALLFDVLRKETRPMFRMKLKSFFVVRAFRV
jgi:PST family polysaccharide transporter